MSSTVHRITDTDEITLAQSLLPEGGS
jgi:hypothetical protein